MGKYLVRKSQLKGEIHVPTSKSHTLRAILFGALGKGNTLIHSYLPSNDAIAMIDAIRLFGAEVDISEETIQIKGLAGKVAFTEDVINAGNSGIVLRFCAAIGALGKLPIVITGDRSIRHQRPMKPILDALKKLGVSALSMRGDDYAPIIIQGPLKSGETLIEGHDSQPVSALLIAFAFAEGPIDLKVLNPGEKPWIGLTLGWFDYLGIPYKNDAFERYHMFGGAKYDGFEYTVPGDFSSAAFPIAAALITQSELLLKNIDMNDTQGDKELITVLQKMGAQIDVDQKKKTLLIKKSPTLKGMEIDINNFIDAITILSVIGCFAEGETHITNAAVARQKECDRLSAITKELRKMGAEITELKDGLIIKQSKLKGAALHSYHDHRMVMSLAVAALGAEGDTTIDSVECVAKTFPTFVRDFNALGAGIKELK